jgi:hypothetical protein
VLDKVLLILRETLLIFGISSQVDLLRSPEGGLMFLVHFLDLLMVKGKESLGYSKKIPNGKF